MNKYLFLLPVVVIAGSVLIPWYRARLLPDEALMARVPSNPFDGLDAWLDGADPCGEFWRRLDGLKGLYKNWRGMVNMARLLQRKIRAGLVTREDAAYAWKQATLQTLFSLRSIPEAFLCCRLGDCPHICAQYALRCHWNFTLRFVTLCDGDAHIGIADTERLL